jgi:hypothetical protein
MKKRYEKPVLLKEAVLSAVTAEIKSPLVMVC